MVIKNDPRKLLDLMGTKSRQADPDDEFLDRLAKKTSFYDQPSTLPETLNLPPVVHGEAGAELDDLADVKLGDEEHGGPHLLHSAAPQLDGPEAAAEAKRRAEHEKKEARYASLFHGRSAGDKDMTGVPDNIDFSKLSSQVQQQALPDVGTAVSAQEAALLKEDEARRAAWAELNRLKEQGTAANQNYQKAHDRFVATYGHRGAELRE